MAQLLACLHLLADAIHLALLQNEDAGHEFQGHGYVLHRVLRQPDDTHAARAEELGELIALVEQALAGFQFRHVGGRVVL